MDKNEDKIKTISMSDAKKITKIYVVIVAVLLLILSSFVGAIFFGVFDSEEDDIYQTIEIWMCEDENGDTWYCIVPETSTGTYINIAWVNFTDSGNGTALLNLKSEHTEWISMYNCWLVAELDVRIND